MDIAELKAFTATSQQGSFSKAAEILHISQPAISRRIQSLELFLGENLFDREGAKIRLTAAGQLLLPQAQSILDLTQHAIDTLKNMGQNIQGSLILAISHHFAEHYLAQSLKTYCQTFLQVRLQFHFVTSEQACDLVADGTAHLGLVTIPAKSTLTSTNQKLYFTPIKNEVLSLVVNAQHPLAIQSTPLDLNQFTAIMPPITSATGLLLQQQLDAAQIQGLDRIECSSFTSLKSLILANLGWGFLPTPLLGPGLVELQCLKLSHVSRQIGLAQHRNRQLSPAAKAYLDQWQKLS